ncbi:Response regulator rcp1 [Posidoniimonas polymericola]|uniref:Response regulator rcp1 n=1 Tax=Posidoniimonas polymericola TaxID=2528002 RepID=A0A5C5YTA8_9BACT|nr:response regulator [Posidoniimonas polymericola]TWT77887.1 Response regulator rcp1 [Posidoniimonas polymericola]
MNAEHASRPPYREVQILLVEDDDVDAEAVCRAFEKVRIGNRIVRAKDGVEALCILRGEHQLQVGRPCVILLDLNLPRMNGIEMLRELRADPALSDRLVFVLTTSDTDSDKVAAYQEHVAGYVVKSRAGSDFAGLTQLLDHYWRIVEFPPERHL